MVQSLFACLKNNHYLADCFYYFTLYADSQNPSSDPKAQMANPWAQNFAPYLRNFQGPMYQQMPPYQGYGFTGMPPPYYPPNMPWPSDLNASADHGSHDRRDRRSSTRRKGKSSHARGSEKEDIEEDTNSSASSSETDSSSEKAHKKKSGKKSSRKVVIRNINYITSKRDGEKDDSSETHSSDEDEYLNGDALKQKLEEAVGSFEKHKKSSSHHKKRNGSKQPGPSDKDDDGDLVKNKNKGNENWDALQQLLLKEESDPEPHSTSVDEKIFAGERSYTQNSSAFKGEEEGIAKRKPIASDAFLVNDKGGDDGKISSGQGFDPSESTVTISRRGSVPDEFLFSNRNEESEGYSHMSLSVDASRSVFRSQTSDDWIIGKQSDGGANLGGNNRIGFIEGDYVRSNSDQKTKDVIIDDSLMIQGRLTDDHPESRLTTDVSLVSDIVEATFIENGTRLSHQNSEPGGFYEPDELYMVRDHDAVVESTLSSCNPELDYEIFSSVNVSIKKSDVDASEESKVGSNEKGSNKKSGKTPSRDPRSRTVGGPLRRAKPEPTPVTRRSTFGSKTATPKSQLEKACFFLNELLFLVI